MCPQINNIPGWAKWIVFVIKLNLLLPCCGFSALYYILANMATPDPARRPGIPPKPKTKYVLIWSQQVQCSTKNILIQRTCERVYSRLKTAYFCRHPFEEEKNYPFDVSPGGHNYAYSTLHDHIDFKKAFEETVSHIIVYTHSLFLTVGCFFCFIYADK